MGEWLRCNTSTPPQANRAFYKEASKATQTTTKTTNNPTRKNKPKTQPQRLDQLNRTSTFAYGWAILAKLYWANATVRMGLDVVWWVLGMYWFMVMWKSMFQWG